MDCSDHGADYQGEHDDRVNQEIDIVILILIVWLINILIKNTEALVDKSWRLRWETVGPVLVHLELLQSSPVTEPDI